MTSAHICLLNDFISRSFAVISSVSPLSPEAIRKLEDSRDGWQQIRSRHFSDLLLMTKLVAFGVVLEGPELVYEIVQLLKRWRKRATKEYAPGWITVIGLAGWIMVSIGVAGEFWVDSWVNGDDGNIQSINLALLEDAGASAATAVEKAQTADAIAKSASGTAKSAKKNSTESQEESSNALTLAKGAREEADTFESDIASAKQQAADAESHLADALERAAEAETKLANLKTPRSLDGVSELVFQLAKVKDAKYRLQVFQDDESMRFLKIINQTLSAAGWSRVPTPPLFGIPSVSIPDVTTTNDSIPVCFDVGIQAHMHSQEGIEILKARPALMQTKSAHDGFALLSALPSHVLPTDSQNVGRNMVLDAGGSDDDAVVICVGQKP
jgi:hypothetical protein